MMFKYKDLPPSEIPTIILIDFKNLSILADML